ncbi:chain length determinant protein tyrosine kinase EpsG [Rhodoferax lacus]|uniref:Chain length determinant protein tyrosine kinase EpsG n=1 Tax=Rhodoferax lacus TaxID=2184758 RepID=A0A3E1RG43_9BURK|nr:chain length determinant protein tyrosine kinase EpsG [Rhodoferax lacus]RFO97992.1 chain length determinant protein tyrosine kinase EpsG [Rhodoferax lacus]
MNKDKEHFHSSLFPADIDIDLDEGPDGPSTNNTPKRSIGKILVDAGVISQDDAIRVMSYQREKGIRFGEAAIHMGLISEGDIRYALSYQYEYAYLPRSSGKATNPELVAAYMPFSHEVDQLRSIRSQLKLRWFDGSEGRAMLPVLGAGRAEGGSYLAANLAIVFAQMGERTLLIDADMRTPRQHVLFQISNQLGFSSLLAGRSDVASALQTISFMPNLQVLTAGPVPPNPLELLNRANLAELMEWASKAYDVVLIDTPSMSVGADAMLIAAKAGAAMVVARANETKLSAYVEMMDALKRSNINIVGAVLNNPPLIDVAH